MNLPRNLLQIVPRLPGEREAVGDYAATLARKLHAHAGWETTFVTGEMLNEQFRAPGDVILHYVNYGYHHRGVPRRLLSILRELRRTCAGKFITIFHELYASGPPWRSAFWLRPLQTRIVADIAQLSHHCIVTNEVARAQLSRLAPRASVSVHPVFSNFGEPQLSLEQIAAREPHRWTICGGTAAIVRALRSFSAQRARIPAEIAPKKLQVIGGNENPDARQLIVDLSGMPVDYLPDVSAKQASQILRECSFAWFDYFHRADVPGAVILKSSAFAAATAHGVIPVFAQSLSPMSGELPVPSFINRLPAASERVDLATNYYDWYQRRASSDCLTTAIIKLLS